MRTRARWMRLATLLIFTLAATLLTGCSSEETKAYGVFIGTVPDESDDKLTNCPYLFDYDTLVIDAQYFTDKQVASLKENGERIYSYLNVGSLEEWRDYASNYSDLSLATYENWEDESWVDVSDTRWQSFIVSELAADLDAKGVDGFFLDNFDVYYLYENEEIYEGLCNILNGLATYNKKVIINGGDTFVSRFLEEIDEPTDLLTGINQESVYTSIDFDNNSFSASDDETRSYYEDYLKLCKEKGLEVYLTEYASDKSLIAEVKKNCEENDYTCYISDSLDLE